MNNQIIKFFIAAWIILFSSLASAQIKKIEISKFNNEAGLGESEIDYLSDILIQTIEQLPTDQFTVSEAPLENATKKNCDEKCLLEEAQLRDIDLQLQTKIVPFGDGYVTTIKLFNVKTKVVEKRVSTKIAVSIEELLAKIEEAANSILKYLNPDAVITVEPDPSPSPQKNSIVPVAPKKSAFTASINVTSSPVGATVYISKSKHNSGEYTGETPVSKTLLPVTYYVTVSHKGYFTQEFTVRLDPGEVVNIEAILIHDYPANPYKVAGHALFWPGLAVIGFGFISMGVAYDSSSTHVSDTLDREKDAVDISVCRAWTGVMLGSFIAGGSAMITAIVLWAISPGDKQYYEKKNRLTVLPVFNKDSATLSISFSRRF
ncbi:MAG: PEGA domain-containing protein [Deltaproteobacteria bacterium]|nr:PEGA domain-containing protein [Deltaproteobacteria bacterium]